MELLKEIAPRIARVAVIYNPDTTANAAGFVQSLQAAAQKFTVQPVTTEVRQVADIEAAAAMLARNPGGGIIVLPDPFTVTNRKPLIAAAALHQLPAVYPFRFFASDGGLISYSVDIPEQFRLAAGYVDRILKGEKPTDLPVQQPAKFELVINLKTAQALGLSIPTTLVATADEAIE
jgi:putative ABC transport system substrate-binding protein